MKSTGIIRRVDPLGRVVIPMEIRKSMNIEEGTPLEIFVEDNKVCFKVYARAEIIRDLVANLEEVIAYNVDIIKNKDEILCKVNEIQNLLKVEDK